MVALSAGAQAPSPPPQPRKAALEVPALLAAEYFDAPLPPDDQPTVVKKGILELHGPIDIAMRTRFDAAIADENITTVRIKSQGGDIVQALHIATVIEAHGINVVVHDLCTGACAQYIFIAGRKRQLEKRSLIGFMNTIRRARG